MVRVWALAVLACLTGASATWAHPLDPSLLELRADGEGVFQVLWRTPLRRTGMLPLEPVIPDHCRPLSAPEIRVAAATSTLRWRVDCGPAGLIGSRIGVEGLDVRKTDALVRVERVDGSSIQAVVRAAQPYLTVPRSSSLLAVGGSYLRLGFEHILTGLDHLAFVLALVLLSAGRRQLLWTITAFTLGHSVTLSLAALGLVHVPQAPAEALIAVSIFVVAVELTRKRDASWLRRSPWAMAVVFGLLHGLGFAGALTEVGLPAGEIPLALFSFNVGIELGQLFFVVLVLIVRPALSAATGRLTPAAAKVPAYAIGSLAAFWVLQRVALLL
jgi:hydrogenase/urease accessory protein HupE